jgi:hypothetical protein
MHCVPRAVNLTPNEEVAKHTSLPGVTVRDGAVTTAKLTELAVPRYRRAFIDSDREKLLNGHFLEIAIHGLTHDTFWSPLVGQRLGLLSA